MLDVGTETDFLNADNKDTEFIWPPDGGTINDGFDVFQFRQAVYCLKQARRAWYKNVELWLKQVRLKPMVNKSCL